MRIQFIIPRFFCLFLIGCNSIPSNPSTQTVKLGHRLNQDSLKRAIREQQLDSVKDVHYSSLLSAIHEPDLRYEAHEVYRICWGEAFNRMEHMIRIELTDSGYYVTTKWFMSWHPSGYSPKHFNDTLIKEFRRSLQVDDWYDLKMLIDGMYFWTRPGRDDVAGLDGWALVIEGQRYIKDCGKHLYHKINRWCPTSDALLSLFHKMQELSGVFYKDEKGIWQERKPEDYKRDNW